MSIFGKAVRSPGKRKKLEDRVQVPEWYFKKVPVHRDKVLDVWRQDSRDDKCKNLFERPLRMQFFTIVPP
jgi:hypothetical protein